MWTFAAALGGIGWLLYVDRSLKDGFDKVDVGHNREQVESILGKPSGIEECGHFGGKNSQTIPAGCVKEYSYLSLLSFVEVWTVGFDDAQRVVSKYRYTSP